MAVGRRRHYGRLAAEADQLTPEAEQELRKRLDTMFMSIFREPLSQLVPREGPASGMRAAFGAMRPTSGEPRIVGRAEAEGRYPTFRGEPRARNMPAMGSREQLDAIMDRTFRPAPRRRSLMRRGIQSR